MSDPKPAAAAAPRKTPWTLIVALIVAVGGGVGWWLTRGDDAPPSEEAASAEDVALQKKRAARAEAADREPAKVGGTVINAKTGEGIAGAQVLLNRDAITQGVAPAAGQPSVPLTATTDETGNWSREGVPSGKYSISASVVGYFPGKLKDVTVVPGEVNPDQRFELELAPGGLTLSGVVSDIGGGPIEGVLMRVDSMEGVNMFGLRRVPISASTDEDGRYALNVSEGRYIISTYHPDYVATFRITHVVGGPRTEDLELAPAGVIEGVVLTREGRTPVADARVTFSDSRMGSAGPDFRTNFAADGRVLTTDSNGKFRLTGLESGIVHVSAWARNAASHEPVAVPLAIGETVTGVEVIVDEAFTVSGYVVPKGDPEGAIEGVMVGIYSLKPVALLGSSDPSAEDGYFEIVGVEKGAYSIGALTDDALPTVMGGSVSVYTEDVDDVILELDSGVYVRGTVDPPEVADISVEMDSKDMGPGMMMDMFGLMFAGTKSAPDGTFEFGPVKPGTYVLKAKGNSGSAGRLEVDVPEAGLEGTVLQMEERASVAGNVFDQTGAPKTGVNVELVSTKPGTGFDMSSAMRSGGVGRGSATNEEGHFVVKGLEPGRYLASVTDNRSRQVEIEGEEVFIEIEATEQRDGVDITVVGLDGEISGTVFDSTGMPMADVWVRAGRELTVQEFGKWVGPKQPKKEGSERLEGVMPRNKDEGDSNDFDLPDYFAEKPVLTDPAGNFLIKGLDSNVLYTVTAEGDRGGQKARAEGVSPGAELTMTLEALASVTGTVVPPSGKLGEYSVKLTGPVDRNKRVRDGSPFEFDRLEPGSYEVTVDADVGFGTAEFELESGQAADVEVELEGFASITGTLVDGASGDPIGDVLVLHISAAGELDPGAIMAMLTGAGGTKTNTDGSFEIEKVTPGKGQIQFLDASVAFSGGGQIADVDYEVEAGDELDLGEIKGVPTSDVPADERGTLGLRTAVRSEAMRPRPPGTDLEEDGEEPDEDADATDRLWVRWVTLDGPAAEAGLVPGDEIVTLDGVEVAGLGPGAAGTKLSDAHVRVGQNVKIGYVRDGSEESVTLEAVAKDGDKPTPEPGG